jgi:hypothetical protein
MKTEVVKAVLVNLDEEGLRALEAVKSGLGTTNAADTMRRALFAVAAALRKDEQVVDYKKLTNHKPFKARLFNQLQLWKK